MKALAVLLALCATAAAGPVPLSQVPSKPARVAKTTRMPAGVTLGDRDKVLTVAPPACFASTPVDGWTSGADELLAHWRSLSLGLDGRDVAFGVERLVVEADHAELDRTLADWDGSRFAATERGRIALLEVARDGDLAVYAYRRGAIVFVVAPSTGNSFARIDIDSSMTSSGLGVTVGSDCGIAMTELRVDHGASQAVQLHVTDDDTPVTIAASISKTSRDREPILSVAIRK